MLIGVDLSYYDPILDWKNYKWDFAIIKASEGTVKDIDFTEQWKAAQGYTIRSAYSFFRAFVDQKLAAQRMVDYLGNDLGELPPVLDLEAADGYGDVPQRALIWLKEMRQLTGIIPIVYTSPGFANAIKLYNFPEFAEYPLWQATYPWDKITATWTEEMRKNKLHRLVTFADPYIFPTPVKPFRDVQFAQFTGKCPPEYVPGYPLGGKLAVDVNFYDGEMKDLFDEFNIVYVPNPADEGDNGMPITGVILATTNIRSTMPGGAYLDIGDLPVGTVIEASNKLPDATGVFWYKLTSAKFNGTDVKTTSGKLVGEVSAWCFGKNVREDISPPTGDKPPFEFTITKEGYKTTVVRLDPE